MAAVPDERRDSYLDREGWQKLASIAADVQHLALSVGQVLDIAERNDRTLRGVNGGDGLVARVGTLEKANVSARLDAALADVHGKLLKLENDLQMVKVPTKLEEAKWYARGKFWLWFGAATGVVGHLATLASIILEKF